MGQITKQGSATLRWALVQAATSVIKFPGKLRSFYHRVERTRGAKRAKVAVARKIVTILWTMLARGEDYAEKEDALTSKKLGRMRGLARSRQAADVSGAVERLLRTGGEEVLRDDLALPA